MQKQLNGLVCSVCELFLADNSENCLLQGVFPGILKHAQVLPLHKKGNKTSLDSYRQVSLLSDFSKLFEK